MIMYRKAATKFRVIRSLPRLQNQGANIVLGGHLPVVFKKFSTNTEVGKALWQASEEQKKRSTIAKFAAIVSNRADKDLSDYWDLYRWSTENTGAFWEEVSSFTNIKWTKTANEVYIPPPEGKIRGAQWFTGSRLNFAENLMPKNSNKTAVVSYVEVTGGAQNREELSGSDIWEAVRKCAHGLKSAGVGPNVRVAGVTINSYEALVAMLATTSLGGVWSSCSPDFGVNGIVDRLGQLQPQVVFFSSGYTYGGKYFDCQGTIREVMANFPAKTLAVLIKAGGDAKLALDTLPSNYKGFDEFMDQCPDSFKLTFEPLPFNHPVYIMFSSGTTGAPKCIVHGAGGTLLQQKKEFMLHCDLTEMDRLFWFTTCGWMMWNWMAASLSVGSTLVTYDGSPGSPDLEVLWKMAELEGLTHFGTSPKFLSACMNADVAPKEFADLHALKSILSTGSPLLPEHCFWVYDKVKSDVHLSSVSGGTDILGCFMGGNILLPVRAGEIQAPCLGMAVESWNDEAKPVVGERAELVCTKPFPSMPIYFLDDPDNEKFTSAYFDNYGPEIPETWWHGDFIEVTENGGIIVHGRSDATLNPGGVRIGTSELYRQVEIFEDIADSIAVGKKTPTGDVEVALFVKMKEGQSLSEDLSKSIKHRIKANLTPRHVPSYVIEVKDIPYTRSGKKVEVAVTKAIHNEKVKNSGALANAECLDEYYGIFSNS